MDTLEAMRVFAQVSEMRSFTKAAHALDISRATVSSAIQQLERRFGFRLMQRTTRQVSLTEDGQHLLIYCLRMLVELEAIESVFLPSVNDTAGRVRLDVPSRIASQILTAALPALFSNYARIELTMTANDGFTDLVHDGVDCALRFGELEDTGLVARQLGRLRQVSCASPAYLSEYGVPETPEDLRAHWMVGYAPVKGGRVLPMEHCHDGAIRTLDMPCRIAVNTIDNYIGCAVAGLGVIQAPLFDVREHLQDGRLQQVLPAMEVPQLPVSVIYPHRRVPARVRAIVAWMEASLATVFQAE